MLGSFHVVLFTIVVSTASERAGQNGDGKGKGPQLQLDERVAEALQTHVPDLKDRTDLGWFSPTGREVGDEGLLKHAIDNIRKQAAVMKEHADNVIDAAHTHGEEIKSFGDVLEKADNVRKQLDEKTLSQLLDLDDKRMKWTDRLLGDQSRYPTESDLLDYIPAVESLSETDERGRRKEGVNEAETGNKLWAEEVGLSVKDLPFRDLLYPHEPMHSRRLEDYTPGHHLLPETTKEEHLTRYEEQTPTSTGQKFKGPEGLTPTSPVETPMSDYDSFSDGSDDPVI